jgi:hypothetical protein
VGRQYEIKFEHMGLKLSSMKYFTIIKKTKAKLNSKSFKANRRRLAVSVSLYVIYSLT